MISIQSAKHLVYPKPTLKLRYAGMAGWDLGDEISIYPHAGPEERYLPLPKKALHYCPPKRCMCGPTG